jgi:hypothetical protein
MPELMHQTDAAPSPKRLTGLRDPRRPVRCARAGRPEKSRDTQRRGT